VQGEVAHVHVTGVKSRRTYTNVDGIERVQAGEDGRIRVWGRIELERREEEKKRRRREEERREKRKKGREKRGVLWDFRKVLFC